MPELQLETFSCAIIIAINVEEEKECSESEK
jgi:hypothetical protein